MVKLTAIVTATVLSMLTIGSTTVNATSISSSKTTTNNILKTKKFPQQRNNKIDLAKEKKLAEFNIERTIKKSEVQWATIDGKNADIIRTKSADISMARNNDNARLAAFGDSTMFSYKDLDAMYSYDLDTYSFIDSEGSMYDIAFLGEWSVTVCNEEPTTVPQYLYTKSETHEKGDPDDMTGQILLPGKDCWNARWYGNDEIEARMYFDTVGDREIDFTLRFASTIISYDMLQVSGTFLSEHMNIWADNISATSQLELVGEKEGVLYFDGVIVIDVLLVGPTSHSGMSMDFDYDLGSMKFDDKDYGSMKFDDKDYGSMKLDTDVVTRMAPKFHW